MKVRRGYRHIYIYSTIVNKNLKIKTKHRKHTSQGHINHKQQYKLKDASEH